MSDRVTRFLGGSPLSVLLRLVLLSIVVGVILSWITDFFNWVWYSLFGSLDRALEYFILGAVIVIPLFVVSRLMKSGRN